MKEFENQGNMSEARRQRWISLPEDQRRDVLRLQRILRKTPWTVNTTWTEEITISGRSGPHGQSQFRKNEVTKNLDPADKDRLVTKITDILLGRLTNTPAREFMDDVINAAKQRSATEESTDPQTT